MHVPKLEHWELEWASWVMDWTEMMPFSVILLSVHPVFISSCKKILSLWNVLIVVPHCLCLSVPPLEGFVMNRVQGDYFETLLYKIFVSIDEQTNVAEVGFRNMFYCPHPECNMTLCLRMCLLIRFTTETYFFSLSPIPSSPCASQLANVLEIDLDLVKVGTHLLLNMWLQI